MSINDAPRIDPAVRALADDGWLGEWDYPITLDDLISAVNIVRRVDRESTPVIRTEWATAAVGFDGTVKHTAADSEAHAALIADSITTHLASLNEPTKKAGGIASVAIVNRDVRQLPDGAQLISPWREVRQGQVLTFADETTGSTR